MIHFLTRPDPDDLKEYEELLGEPLTIAYEFYVTLSDIERAYAFTLIEVSSYLPWINICKLPGSLYKFVPDQRPYTLRLIGKPSHGPSPPMSRHNSQIESVKIHSKNIKNTNKHEPFHFKPSEK